MAARADLSRARGALRRVRNALGEALPALAALEELGGEIPDHIGRYRLESGETLDERDVLDFLRLARTQNPGAMDIIVLGRSEENLSEVTGQQAEHSGGSDERSADGERAGHRAAAA